jgi:hypothetical protein
MPWRGASRQAHRSGAPTQHQNLTSTLLDIIVKMRSWGTPIVFAGLLVLFVAVSAIELPTGPNVPTNAAITLTGASLTGVSDEAEAATPSRVLPTPAIMSTRVSVRLSSKQAVPQDVPAGGLGLVMQKQKSVLRRTLFSRTAFLLCKAFLHKCVWHAAVPCRLHSALSFPTSLLRAFMTLLASHATCRHAICW